MTIQLKRAYEKPSDDDGYRVLVDRLWPRGIKKEELSIFKWMKEVSPSNDLRKQFKHEPESFQEFHDRYFDELRRRDAEIKELKKLANEKLTLIYAAKNERYNNAVVLKDFLEKA